MRLVSDGHTYGILLRSSDGECRLRELPEGTTTTRPCSDLTPVNPAEIVDGFDVISPSDHRKRSGRALALVLELTTGGPASARQLLDRFDACESELHGAVSELRAAGLIEPTTVYGERGYRATAAARDAISTNDLHVAASTESSNPD